MYDKNKLWHQDVQIVINNLKYPEKIAAADEIYNFAINNASLRNKLGHSESSDLLRSLMQFLHPDVGKRREDADESKFLLEIHLVALKVLHLCNHGTLTNSSILCTDNVSTIFNLITIEKPDNPHEKCCLNAIHGQWHREALDFAKKVLLGQMFECVSETTDCVTVNGEIYDSILYKCDSAKDVVDVLREHPKIQALDLSKNLSSSSTTTSVVKVTHVISPDYVWVQDVSYDLEELNQEMADYVEVAAEHNTTNLNAVVKLDKFLFRAQVESWGPTSAQVFAIDYGWKVQVPHSSIYSTDENISELPPLAKLCHIINIVCPSTNLQIQIYAVKLLQPLTYYDRFADAILSNPGILGLLKVLSTTRSSTLIYAILVLFSQLCYHEKYRELCCNVCLRPVLACLRRWLLYPRIVAIGMECLRNVIVSRHTRNKEDFIMYGGLELTFKTLSSYSQHTTIGNHCTNILKQCLKNYEFEVESNEPSGEMDKLSLSDSPKKAPTFCHLHNMSQYNVKGGNTVSFVENILQKADSAIFAREVVSHLNTETGGLVYIGITNQGLINGLKLNRRRKDEYRMKLDSVLTKSICDYRQIELPGQLFECQFQLVENTYKRTLPDDVTMFLIKVTIQPARLLARVALDQTVFWKRERGRCVPLSNNEIRQALAEKLSVHPVADN